MELLLNIIWLGLIVPAIWLWRRKPQCVPHAQTPYRAFIILGCALLLLFPVVSASDDLNALRPEMEDSNPSAGLFKNSAGSKSTISIHATGTYQRSMIAFIPLDDQHGQISISSPELPELAPRALRVSRGPPAKNLS